MPADAKCTRVQSVIDEGMKITALGRRRFLPVQRISLQWCDYMQCKTVTFGTFLFCVATLEGKKMSDFTVLVR
jgi:hypothetical protein